MVRMTGTRPSRSGLLVGRKWAPDVAPRPDEEAALERVLHDIPPLVFEKLDDRAVRGWSRLTQHHIFKVR